MEESRKAMFSMTEELLKHKGVPEDLDLIMDRCAKEAAKIGLVPSGQYPDGPRGIAERIADIQIFLDALKIVYDIDTKVDVAAFEKLLVAKVEAGL